MEVFDGLRRLSQAIQSLSASPGGAARAAGAGVDVRRKSYGQFWGLSQAKDRARLRYLFFEALKPAGAHWALPRAK